MGERRRRQVSDSKNILGRRGPTPPPRVRRLLDLAWADWKVGAAVAVAVAAVSGVLIALAIPRGPVTAAQALVLMVSGLAVGLVAGFVLRSRWAMLLAPVAHVAAFELGRIGADGPTVDGIHPDTMFGILAFIVGRGFYGLLGLLPNGSRFAPGARIDRCC